MSMLADRVAKGLRKPEHDAAGMTLTPLYHLFPYQFATKLYQHVDKHHLYFVVQALRVWLKLVCDVRFSPQQLWTRCLSWQVCISVHISCMQAHRHIA